MKLLDANILLDAVNASSSHQAVVRPWLDDALSGADTIAFAWVPVLAFVRVSTHADVFERPLSIDEAVDQVEAWLAAKASVVIEPTARHPVILRNLLLATGSTGGNLVNDAHLAALAIEHRATIVSYDTDFARFPGVTWSTPG